VISGNAVNGVEIILAGATANSVQGNFIGTDATGSSSLGNGVISGNLEGVTIDDPGAQGNLVQGNYIGTDVTGTSAIANRTGVLIITSANNTIGGTTSGARNVISGNAIHGVEFVGAGATGNQVQGNFIGTDVSGTAAIGNGEAGVGVDDAPNNTVGGTTAEARNIISGNEDHGVRMRSAGATGNLVQGNYIGTDVNGMSALPNGSHGVLVENAPSNTIGGTTAEARNVISGNLEGVTIGHLR
jgi:titin